MLSESASVLFCTCALAWEKNMAATLRVFRAEYRLLCSDWLKCSGDGGPEPSFFSSGQEINFGGGAGGGGLLPSLSLCPPPPPLSLFICGTQIRECAHSHTVKTWKRG